MASRVISRSIAVAIFMLAGAARAQATDPAGAESLFDEGRKLMDKHDYDAACPKLEASNKLDPAVGTLLNLGECNEKRNRYATAWSNYKAAASLAQARGDARGAFAQKRADAMSTKYSTLTIEVVQAEPGLKVMRDGLEVAEGAWGTAIPIDAGSHAIEAKAPGKRTNLVKLTVAEGAPSSNVVKLEPLVADSSATPPPTPTNQVTTTPQPQKPTPGASEDHTGMIVGGVGMGVGAVGITVGAILAFSAKGKWNDAKAQHCNAANQCDDVGFQMNQDARSQGTVATVLLGAGLVIAVGGVAAFLFWPKADAPKTGVRMHGAGFEF